MKEVWRDIAGYEGLYQVSNFGNIRSFDKYTVDTIGRRQFHKGKILKLNTDKNGYPIVALFKNRESITFKVHRIMAMAFIPNPNNLPLINHKDESKYNNFIWVNEDGSVDMEKSNLEWCDAKYNTNYGTAINRRVKNTDFQNIASKNSKPILQYSKNGRFIKKWTSQKEASDNLNIDRGTISKCCSGLIKTAGGYEWKFLKNI